MQEKHERMKNLKSLREKETKLCERLCLPAHDLGQVNVPTKEQLKELEANVQYLQKEQVNKVNRLMLKTYMYCCYFPKTKKEKNSFTSRPVVQYILAKLESF